LFITTCIEEKQCIRPLVCIDIGLTLKNLIYDIATKVAASAVQLQLQRSNAVTVEKLPDTKLVNHTAVAPVLVVKNRLQFTVN